MTFVLFGLIALFLLYVINLLRVEYTFFILFFIHLISGIITQKYGFSLFGVSPTGMINFLTLGMLILNLPHCLKPETQLRHNFLLYFLVLLLFYSIPLLYNFDFQILTRFISRFGALISIYYLGQISFSKIKNFENKFVIFLKFFFIFVSVAGLINLISIGLDFERSRIDRFSFFFFEYPHSFSIFATSFVPIFSFYIFNKQLSKYYYSLILFFIPLAILYCGAKIGIIVYIFTLTSTILLTFRKTASNYIISIFLLTIGTYFFISTPVFQDLMDVFSVPLDNYITDASSYSFNTLHSRTKVWAYMFFNLMHEDNLLFGFGWRAWSMKHLYLSGEISSQSDYFTILFDLGLLGLFGFLVFRVLLIYHLIKKGGINSKLYYLAIGMLGSLFIGGFTENVEGYPSTNWLIPLFLSLSHYYIQKDSESNTIANA